MQNKPTNSTDTENAIKYQNNVQSKLMSALFGTTPDANTLPVSKYATAMNIQNDLRKQLDGQKSIIAQSIVGAMKTSEPVRNIFQTIMDMHRDNPAVIEVMFTKNIIERIQNYLA